MGFRQLLLGQLILWRLKQRIVKDFFSEEIGSYYYNRGLRDARSVLESRLENIDEALYEIEKPTEFAR
ncbi:MAG: DUF2164 domain-containing protein [Candidatus Thiodiazotropha taylori]|nr:DUF2164 domain-containing protein [Candidatus Thiodiazotropha taylori]